MFGPRHASAIIYLFVTSATAQAAVVNVTGANLKAAFLAANSGDTIIVTGVVAGASLLDRSFTKTVTIDATNASFTDTLMVMNVDRLKIVGGTFGSTTADMRTGRAVGVYDSSFVTLTAPTVIGNGNGHGISVVRSADVVVSKGDFSNLRLGLGISSSERVRATSGRFTGMTSDGMNIADSHNVTANFNRCSGNNPSVGAHTDCIQLWSVKGRAVQSDITLSKNIVEGPTQGLTSFNPDDGGGLRITMTDNRITTSKPQGIACYNCVDSLFSGNVLTTLPGSAHQTTMNIIGGSNNTIINNSIGPRPAALAALGAGAFADYESLPDYLLEDPGYLADLNESGDAARSFGISAATVPEPMVWAQLLLGFGFTGLWMRRRTHGAVAA